MSRFVKTLERLTLDDIPTAGGKACRLGELARAGLPVPRGAVVLVSAYDAALGAGGPGPRTAESVRESLMSGPLPQGFEDELAGALERCGLGAGTPLAVRSSAIGEDGGYRSRAGAYDSVLNVLGREAVLEAVRRCWASAWTERAALYNGRAGDAEAARARAEPPPPAVPAMAVLVQELVPCEVAGILFTLNPLTADENEMLVEATWGLAAELASGEVTPDRFVIDFWDGSATRSEIGRKPEALSAAPGGGLERRGVDPRRALSACLDSRRLAELAAAGRRVQEVFGRPQDIEFGFGRAGSAGAGGDGGLWVFQARPITAYSFSPDAGQWTTANFREVMPGFASLLGQSQSFHHDFSRAQEELFRRLRLWRPEDEGTVWSRTFFGHGYWNVGATKRAASRIPGFNERSFDRTVGIDPTYVGDGLVTPWNAKTIAGAIPVLVALGREYRRIPEEAKAFTEWFDREEPGWDEICPAELDGAALAERVRWGLDLHWQVNRWALLTSLLSTQAQEDFHRTMAALDRKRSAGATPDLPTEARLMTGLEGMATARPLHDMWELADSLRRYPGALDLLRNTAPGELARRLPALARSGPGAEAWRLVAGWIARYRYMSNIDEDPSVPRWHEDPSVPLSMLRGYVADAANGREGTPAGTPAGTAAPRGRAGGRRPDEDAERQRKVRAEEEARARAVGRRWLRYGLDPFWLGRFQKQYELVKTFCRWREETRVYLSRARYHTRRFLVEQAGRWAAAGLLADADDIFWLTRDEVLALAGRESRAPSGGESSSPPPDFYRAREAARRRRSLAVLYRNFAVPSNIQPGPFGPDGQPRAGAAVGVASMERAGATAEGGPALLTGVGCSAGTATARCRVARDIVEAAGLRAGEILVAPHANPAWVPLFNLAAGLVLEEGGLLSHSAVVAREYGVPAVLQVKRATELLRTGDVVSIDGLTGTVLVSRTQA